MFHPQNEAGTSGRDPLFLTYEIKDLTVSKSIFRLGQMFHAGWRSCDILIRIQSSIQDCLDHLVSNVWRYTDDP